MSTMPVQCREENGPLHERVSSTGSRQANGHTYSPLLSTTPNDGARTSTANLTALMPPSMWSRSSNTAAERCNSDSSESSTPSRLRKRKSPKHPLADKGSADSADSGETGTGYRKQSLPCPYLSNLSPSSERRCGSSLSDVSVNTAEEESSAAFPPPPPAVAATTTWTNRPISASDYAPLSEKAEKAEGTDTEATELVAHTLPKLARLRFGSEPTVMPRTPPFSPAEKTDSAPLANAAPKSSSSPTPSAAATMSTEDTLHSPSPSSQPPLSTADATLASTPVAMSPAGPTGAVITPSFAPHRLHPTGAGDAEVETQETGFLPLPEIPVEASRKRHVRHQSLRTATWEQTQAGSTRTRSARRPTQSVQTARARAQQRRHAVSSSPRPRGSPVKPQPDSFPGAKRLDDDGVPLSTKIFLGTACVVGVVLVGYLARSIYRYASVNIMEPSTPAPASKLARARMPKEAVVTDKAAAKIARDIRDRIVQNMQKAVQANERPAVVAKESA